VKKMRRHEEVNKKLCHPELVSGSHQCTPIGKILKSQDSSKMNNRTLQDDKNRESHCSHVATKAARRFAFTLAEVLIVLGLIGIVAESTIPTLITNVMTKVFTQSSTITVMKITEATNQMKVDGVLDGYATNDAFVDAFKKYMKVTKTCDSTTLVKCFPVKFKTGTGKDVDTTTLTTGTQLGDNNITGNTIAMMLANGTSVLFTLRDSTKVSEACERIDPFDNTKDTTGCMSLLYDTNGMGSPNMMGKDIGAINATISTCDGYKLGAMCVDAANTTYTPINTCDGSVDISYDPSGSTNTTCAVNYWAGARKACAAKSMSLPTGGSGSSELNTMYQNFLSGGNLVGMAAVTYWSDTEDGALYAWSENFSSAFKGARGKNNNGILARCVK